MAAPYVRPFLGHYFSVQCQKNWYCFICQAPFCSHCCPEHRLHHPTQPKQRTAQVRYIGARTMISAQDTTGVGFDFRRIQWRHYQGGRWMYLQRPQDALPDGYKYSCISCLDKNKKNFDYCAVACQVDHDHDANAIILAQNLLAADWERQDTNAYCTRCRRSICTTLCDLHLDYHHVNQAAQLIHVFRHNNWCLVQAGEQALPAALFDGVQAIIVDGVPMHPIRNRPPQFQVPAAAEGLHPCAYASCMEGIPDAVQFCSLLCHLSTDAAGA